MPTRIDRAALEAMINGPLGVRIRALLALCMVLGFGAVGTLALWSNSATATSGEFKTGVVDLRVNGVKQYPFAGSPGSSMAGMLPGESQAVTLTVQNTLSTLPITYTMAASTPSGSPVLGNYLRMTVYSTGTPTNGTSGGLRNGTCSGTVLGTSLLRAGSSTPVVTQPRPLSAGVGGTPSTSTQALCIIVALAQEAPITVQSQAVASITLNFSATST